jgi:hypothetical protein
MNVEVCDPCYHVGSLVLGDVAELHLGDDHGVLTLCADHRRRLDEALEAFVSVSRMLSAGGGGKFPCDECGHRAPSKDALRKHKERHRRATQAETQLQVA